METRSVFIVLPLVVAVGLFVTQLHAPSSGASGLPHAVVSVDNAEQLVASPGAGGGRSLLQDAENDKHTEDAVREVIRKLIESSLLPMPTAAAQRCGLALGTWCMQYMLQVPAQRYPPPYYDKPCPANCNGVGQCNFEYGICQCPAGWGGPDCATPRKRPCHHMGTDKRDAGWHNFTHWSHTRCAGVCDDDIAMCYCPPDTFYGRVEAPAGSAPGTPPVQRGRPLFMCSPGTDKDGRKVLWGGTPYEDMFGPDGWCNAKQPKFTCPCRMDGMSGQLCEGVVEQTCVNQCSGRGACNQGFCKCYEGWYGADCGLRRAGKLNEDGDEVSRKPWLQPAITHVVATEDPPMTPQRRRPYIYVYDMKPDYSTDLLQYRIEGAHCLYRSFDSGNRLDWVGYNGYSAEPVMHELFLTSEHRTLDPEEADFFFVPISMACLFDVYGWNEIPRWPQGILGPRSHGASVMQREAMRWVNATFPWFARRGGRDHIWLTSHDEGACYVWKSVWPGIFLTHWGRTDFPHESQTAYGMDNYTIPLDHRDHPGDWRDHTSRTHPCFDPKKDLVVPTFKQPKLYHLSPYLGAPPRAAGRDILAFFMGDMRLEPGRDPNCVYSRCIRQTLYNISKAEGWKANHNIWYGQRADVGKEDYSGLLARSNFCFVLPGDGYSPRLEDSILHGCIPVIIMDGVQAVFESVLDFSQFSVRIAQKDLHRVVEIIKAIPPDRVQALRDGVNKVWHRFRYMGLRMIRADARRVADGFKEQSQGAASRHPGAEFSIHSQDDAFDTIMQWLFSRIPDIQGTPPWPHVAPPPPPVNASAPRLGAGGAGATA